MKAIHHKRCVRLVVLLVAALVTGCDRHAESESPESNEATTPIRAQLVQTNTLNRSTELTGHVRSKRRVVVESRLTAHIRQLDVIEGQSVAEGAVLVVLDSVDLLANVERSSALYESAALDLVRSTTLLEQGAISKQEFEHRQAEAAALKATAAELKVQLGFTELHSPFSAVVSRKHVSVGDLALPGKPLLELDDPTCPQFEVHIPETLMHSIQHEQALSLRVAGVACVLTGIVVEVSSASDPATFAVRVVLDIPAVDGLRMGQSGHVSVPAAKSAVLSIPSTALFKRGQMECVFVVDQGHANLRIVRTGREEGGFHEILAGLDAGELVAVSPPVDLRDGQAVELMQ